MKKCTNNRTLSFRRLLSLLRGHRMKRLFLPYGRRVTT